MGIYVVWIVFFYDIEWEDQIMIILMELNGDVFFGFTLAIN